MRILLVSSEVAPFAKTGGLGDVSAALPRALRALGHEVRVVAPFYQRVRTSGRAFERVLPPSEITLGAHRYTFSVLASELPGSDVPVLFVDCPALYDRASIYTEDPDEHRRFALLSWAALKLCQYQQWAPDVVHANDWQTALLPLMLQTVFAWDRLFERTRSVLTIHNIGHQGAFPASILPDTGLADAASSFHQDQLRGGRLNYLLTGILYANAITTVSPTYAREITTVEHGVGLDPFLRARRDVLFGILNGIDPGEWSPERDMRIPFRFSRDDLANKERDKEALMSAMKLPYVRGVPVIGIVSRLVWQKGFELCDAVLPTLLARRDVQVVVLGSGEGRYEELFARLARQHPRKLAFHRGFSEPLAHLIEAGADMFLMPSRYEPCGLNQMYSLAYGTVPIVHATGGLADTVRTWDARTGEGNGFAFEHFDASGLAWALGYALETWNRREQWARLQQNGMRDDFSWTRRVRAYEELYRAIAPG
ncbi:glycogen synthase GlgA [Sandaracinus amylolyticus]|uniref:glycogen synthase GlgA n=1 Tax=Sandaracinus amylolyticus TaxID=927083 RepID=UPI00094625DB|nr:glycogen synthase GlgA [Sandaracinus amylolyticus]